MQDAYQKYLADPAALARVGQQAHDAIPIPWSRLVDDVLVRYGELIKK